MEKNKIIVIGLIVVIVVLAAVLGVMMLSPHKDRIKHNKQFDYLQWG